MKQDIYHPTLCCNSTDGSTKDFFVPKRKPNKFYFSHSQPVSQNTPICSDEPSHASGGWRLTTMTPASVLSPSPQNFLEVLQSWGNTWLWGYLLIACELDWLHEAIEYSTLVAVTDGSYIHELYPNLCSTAFVIECAKGWGHLIGSFLEALIVANAYQDPAEHIENSLQPPW